MKIGLTACFFFLCLNASFAREQDSLSEKNARFVIFLSAGAAFPLGKFSAFEIDSGSYNQNIAGGARRGINGMLELDYYFTESFGALISLQSSYLRAGDPKESELFYDPQPW